MFGFLKRNFLLVLIVAALCGGVYYCSGAKTAAEVKAPSVPIKVAEVARADVPLTLTQVGTVVANQTVAVRSRLDSQIMEVKFRDGDYVHQGDVLFVLDDRTLKSQYAQEKANLVNLQAQYTRTTALVAKQYVSRADVDQSKASFEAQKAMLDAIATQIEFTRIKAPIEGRTGTINVTVGNTVKANDAVLVTINQIKPIRVQMSLPQQHLDAVRAAMSAGELPVTATHEAISSEGKLEYIDNMVDQNSGTFAARALFNNESEALWPGMFVNIAIQLGLQKDAVVVPEVAVQHGQEGDFVFIIAENKAAKRNVKVARMQGGKAVIESGIAAGETVAVDGLMALKDGNVVTIAEPKAAETAAPAQP